MQGQHHLTLHPASMRYCHLNHSIHFNAIETRPGNAFLAFRHKMQYLVYCHKLKLEAVHRKPQWVSHPFKAVSAHSKQH